jgi:uncharacterized protein YodC (DUF2158 family)
MEELQIGDIVELKSGGPDMTVTNISNATTTIQGQMTDTTWFAGKKNERGTFPTAALKLVVVS